MQTLQEPHLPAASMGAWRSASPDTWSRAPASSAAVPSLLPATWPLRLSSVPIFVFFVSI